MNNLLKLSKAAESQPQAAFSVLFKSMQFEWSYLHWILLGCEEAIWNTLNQHFWPAIFEGTISDHEKQLFSISALLGGMGVCKPTKSAKIAYPTSRASTRNIVDAMKGKAEFSLSDRNDKHAHHPPAAR